GWDAEKGPQLIGSLRVHRPNLPVIVLSHGDSVSVAVEAMRAGASDFLVRPVAPERLLEALAANADRRRAAGELAPVSEKLAPMLELEQLIGAAPDFRAALAVAAKSARNRLPVLIIGEPGTGKETLARAIHGASLRAKGPLHTLDCKAVPANSRPLPDDFHPGLAERIGATTVTLPPLRERSGDIPELARHLLQRLADQAGIRALSIGNDALAVLMRYGWPGNVRQLAGVLFRATLQCDNSSLTAQDFPHIATQSRYSARRTDFAPTVSAERSEEM